MGTAGVGRQRDDMHWSTVSHQTRSVRRILFHVALVGLIPLFSSVGCNRPSVNVVNGSTAVVDLQTLGEYPTTIWHIRLLDQRTSGVVWEVKRKSGTPQLHGLTLKTGENSVVLADADTGTYEVVAPVNSKVFHLDPGNSYQLEIWKSEGGNPVRVDIKFGR
jgi:hypothetical protein